MWSSTRKSPLCIVCVCIYRCISLLSIVGKVIPLRARSTIDMLFSLCQLQEKCREQQVLLYIIFIDLTKAFDLVSRSGLFQLLEKIGCSPKLLSMITDFPNNMNSTVRYYSNSNAFPIKSGVKQGCILAPILFGIFFSLVRSHAFRTSEDGIYIHTRSDGKLFNLVRLKAKSKISKVLIRELLFADDAALTSHSADRLQRLIDRFADACKEFDLNIKHQEEEHHWSRGR